MLPRLLLVVAALTCAESITRSPTYKTRSPTANGLTRSPNFFRPTNPRPTSEPFVGRTVSPTIKKETRPPASKRPTSEGFGRTMAPTSIATPRPTIARDQRSIPQEDLPVHFLEVSSKVAVQDPTPEVLGTLVDLWCMSLAKSVNKASEVSQLQCHCLQPVATNRQDPVCEVPTAGYVGDDITFVAKYFESAPGAGLGIAMGETTAEIAWKTASEFIFGSTADVTVVSVHQAISSVKNKDVLRSSE